MSGSQNTERMRRVGKKVGRIYRQRGGKGQEQRKGILESKESSGKEK